MEKTTSISFYREKKWQSPCWDWVPIVANLRAARNVEPKISPIHVRRAYGLDLLSAQGKDFVYPYCPARRKREEQPMAISGDDPNGHQDRQLSGKKRIRSQPECRCRKENINCLNRLGVEVWEKGEKSFQAYCKAAKGLRTNPLERLRETSGQPVGLRNLGATCYVNAPLQVWYHNLAFRRAVYELPIDSSQESWKDSPQYQLQLAFACMQHGKSKTYDPTPFVSSLALSRTEQQDCQEFGKLFLSLLEKSSEKSGTSASITPLRNLFEGKLAYVTKCLKCKAISLNETTYTELEVPLKNNATLEECLEATLATESLTGPNQYKCAKCKSYQDATRFARLCNPLPPVLQFQLNRFLFDLSSMTKKKVQAAIRFPSMLDMRQFLRMNTDMSSCRAESPGSSAERGHEGSANGSAGRNVNTAVEGSEHDYIYKLQAVLLHSGPNATSGHYVAAVWDTATRRWLKFDDALVTTLEDPDLDLDFWSSNSDASRNKRIKKNGGLHAGEGSSERASQYESVVNPLFSRYRASRNAYTLVYARETEIFEALPDANYTGSTDEAIMPKIPAGVLEEVNVLNAKLEKEIREYEEQCVELKDEFELKKKQRREVSRVWHVTNDNEEAEYVSAHALEGWVMDVFGLDDAEEGDASGGSGSEPILVGEGDSRRPFVFDDGEGEGGGESSNKSQQKRLQMLIKDGALDNTDITCEHGRLSVENVARAKRISKVAAELICSFGFAIKPRLTSESFCLDCVTRICKEKLRCTEHADDTDFVRKALRIFAKGDFGYWVSKEWLKDWQKRSFKSHDLENDNQFASPESPQYAEDVRCVHGNLSLSDHRRRVVPPQVYGLLCRKFPTFVAPSTSDDPCPLCAVIRYEHDEETKDMREMARVEKDSVHWLYSATINTNRPKLGNTYYLIAKDFVRAWREFLDDPGDRPRPEKLDNTALLCAEHGRLLYDLNDPEEYNNTVHFSVVNEAEWQTLHANYRGGPPISFFVCPCDQGGPGTFQRIPNPEVCVPCRTERRLQYDEAMVFYRRRIETPADPASGTSGESTLGLGVDEEGESRGGDAKEKSTSRNRNGGAGLRSGTASANSLTGVRRLKRAKSSAPTKMWIKKTDTVKDIKIAIMGDINVPPLYQRLFLEEKELHDEETVEKLKILPGTCVDIVVFDESTAVWETDHLPLQRKAELGFQGTGLLRSPTWRLVEHSGGRAPQVEAEAEAEDHHLAAALSASLGNGFFNYQGPTIDDVCTAANWRCERCTLDNPPDRDVCEACFSPKS